VGDVTRGTITRKGPVTIGRQRLRPGFIFIAADVIGAGAVALADPSREQTKAFKILRAGEPWNLAK
jgi:hypothetical protein